MQYLIEKYAFGVCNAIGEYVKIPTSSIRLPRQSVNRAGEPVTVETLGRHDPCVGIRAVPVGEAMMACVILDHILLDRGQTGGVRGKIG